MKKWTLNSWKNYPAKHLPNYADQKELDLVLSKIKSYPPLVFAGETRSLKKALAQVVVDCGNTFWNCPFERLYANEIGACVLHEGLPGVVSSNPCLSVEDD